MTASTGPSSGSAAEPVATRAEQLLSDCRKKVRAGDTVIKRARLGVHNLSERVQAPTDSNSVRVNLEEAKRILTPTGVAEPNDVKRYKAAADAYVNHRQTCKQVPNAPIEIASQLRRYTKCGRAQQPVLVAR